MTQANQRTSSSTISLFSAVNVVVASMLGAGIYTTSGFTLADLGSPWLVIAAWGVGGLLALCGAISYGALAGQFAESGGEYLFLSRAVHPIAGNIAGFVSLLAGFTGAMAFAAATFEEYSPGILWASDAEPLDEAAAWIEAQRVFWNQRLDALERELNKSEE